MIELFITACLLTNASHCRDVSLVYLAQGVTPQECIIRSQVEISKWSASQPKWFASRWGCRPAGQTAKL